MPTPRETILAALHARLSALPATALRGDVLPERVPAAGLLILRDGEPGEPEVTLSPLRYQSIAYHMKSARFPAYKDLSGFDFATSEINEATVRTLHRCEFMDGAQNVVLIGGPGTGKTHVATAIGVQAIEHHRRKVRFFSTIELVNALEQEKTKGKAGQIAEAMTKLDLVILDELGYPKLKPWDKSVRGKRQFGRQPICATQPRKPDRVDRHGTLPPGLNPRRPSPDGQG